MKKNKLPKQTHPLITADHLRRLAIIYVRHGTGKRAEKNKRCGNFKKSLAAVARSHGWRDCQIRVLEDIERSGSSKKWPPGWERLQNLLSDNRVGIVFIANLSRLFEEIAEIQFFRVRAVLSHTLLYTGGRFVDPGDSDDPVFSEINAMMADYVRKLHGVTPTMKGYTRPEIHLDQLSMVRAAAKMISDKYNR